MAIFVLSFRFSVHLSHCRLGFLSHLDVNKTATLPLDSISMCFNYVNAFINTPQFPLQKYTFYLMSLASIWRPGLSPVRQILLLHTEDDVHGKYCTDYRRNRLTPFLTQHIIKLLWVTWSSH